MSKPFCEMCGVTLSPGTTAQQPFVDPFNRATDKSFCNNKCFYAWLEKSLPKQAKKYKTPDDTFSF